MTFTDTYTGIHLRLLVKVITHLVCISCLYMIVYYSLKYVTEWHRNDIRILPNPMTVECHLSVGMLFLQ